MRRWPFGRLGAHGRVFRYALTAARTPPPPPGRLDACAIITDCSAFNKDPSFFVCAAGPLGGSAPTWACPFGYAPTAAARASPPLLGRPDACAVIFDCSAFS